MIVYPNLISAIEDGRDLDELAASAGISTGQLSAIILGGLAPAPSIRDRLAAALDADPEYLFQATSVLPESIIDLEPALSDAPSRYVRDQATLRKIDGRSR